MAKSKSQRMKEYRERKKASLGEEWYKRERLRTKSYYKPIENLTSKDKIIRRERIRKNVAAYRKRQKQLANQEHNDGIPMTQSCSTSESNADENGVSSTTQISPLVVSVKGLIGKKSCGKSRTSHALKRANNRVRDLQRKNIILERKLKTSRKTIERQKKKNIKSPKTPRGKTDKLMQMAGLDSSEKKLEPIKKKLLFAECVAQEVQESCERNPRKRKIVGNVVSGRIMNKYRLTSELARTTKLKRRTIQKPSKDLSSSRRPRNLYLSQKIASDVKSFLCRDDNSRCMPGKADVVKDGKESKQKRILNDYLHNLHLKFTAEHTYKISLASFARYRPKYVALVNYASRNTCLCQKHQDFALLLRGMKLIGAVVCTSPDKYVDSHTDGIEEDLDKIKEDKIQYKQWKRIKMSDGKEKMRIVDVEKNRDEFKEEVRKKFDEFKGHVHRVKTQYEAVKKMKEQLPVNHALVQMDFAENYSCQNLDEIQSAYWNATMVTLHPTITYLRSADGSVSHNSTVYVSDVLQHNAGMVNAIIKDLMENLKETSSESITHIHFWTDSPTSQYRNKSMFDITSRFESMFGVKASWHFFESGHGKGPCDGIGGTTKRNADNAVKQGKATIQDANDFFTWASSDTSSQIKYRFISKDDFEMSRMEVEDRGKQLVPVKGTMKVHAAVGVTTGVIHTRELTCVCPECFGADGFRIASSCGWKLHKMEKGAQEMSPSETLSAQANQPQTDPDESSIPSVKSSDQVNLPQTNDQNESRSTNVDLPVVGTFVAAIYDQKLYFGKVLETDQEERDINISFMEAAKTEGQFKWPRKEDSIWVEEAKVLCSLSAPNPKGRFRRVFAFSDVDLAMAHQNFAKYKSGL